MEPQNYDRRFQLKTGKYVYEQSASAIAKARRYARLIRSRYRPHEIFYHLGARDGHIAALRRHRRATFFSRFDVANFFGCVTRTKIVRALRHIGFSRKSAYEIAFASVVVEGSRRVVPYGFCQSPLLATLALEYSLLGRSLLRLHDQGFLVTVYMDDILISCDDSALLREVSNDVIASADIAGFPFSGDKSVVAETAAVAFNCFLDKDELSITPDRFDRFLTDYASTSDLGRVAIERYIDAVSRDELIRFRSALQGGF